MNSKKRQPLAWIVDDEPIQRLMMTTALKKLGIQSQMASTAKEFIQNLKQVNPDICFVDLNIEKAGVGYTAIQAIRKILGPEPILFVVSAISDQAAIAHAMEVGANDYIIKPLDLEVLTTKISRYITTEPISWSTTPLLPVPRGGTPAKIHFSAVLQEIDEFGIQFTAPHLIPKGTEVLLQSSALETLLELSGPLTLMVSSSWILVNGPGYGMRAEFDLSQEALLTKVRLRLAQLAS